MNARKNTSHLVELGSGGGAHFATSARLAMTQELIDLNSFYDKYGDTKAKLEIIPLKKMFRCIVRQNIIAAYIRQSITGGKSKEQEMR